MTEETTFALAERVRCESRRYATFAATLSELADRIERPEPGVRVEWDGGDRLRFVGPEITSARRAG